MSQASSATAELERNKAVALRFKKFQGTPEMPRVEKEVLAPGYNRVRGGNFHLAANARDQGWPEPGLYLRKAFPDRVDIIERVIAEGDRVGLLFRLTATHTGNLFGIPPTGRKVDVYEIALLRIVGGQMVEGWFMVDEAELLRQLGARMPVRSDGRMVAPPLPAGGESAEGLLARLSAAGLDSESARNKLAAIESKTRAAAADATVAPPPLRKGFQHLHDFGAAQGYAQQSLRSAFPDRHDTIDFAIAEGDQVWTRFNVHGTHAGELYGLPASDKPIGVPEVGIARYAGGRKIESWYFGDELGLLLQIGAPNLLLEPARR
jgi:predicted ester cyclase